MLRDLGLKAVYRSDKDNLLRDFYLPALRESIAYDRAVGFFSAAMLSFAAQGISALAESGGAMRLIFGGELEADDAAAMHAGYEQKRLADRVGPWIVGSMENLGDALARNRLEALAWLIASGKLEIKVALKLRGMYHEKIGIFRDSSGDQVVFQGSANETVHALLPDFNFESVNVFPTWRDELKDHFVPYLEGFERLWNNQTKGTVVIEFPDAARDHLIKVAKRSKPPSTTIEEGLWSRLASGALGKRDQASGPHMPVTVGGLPFEIRAHQRDALNAWKSNDFQGILAIATGAGKTITAIYGLVRIFEANPLARLFVIIAVPYQSLADQWIDNLVTFGISAVPCYADRSKWETVLSQKISLFAAGALRFVACVVVNKTLQMSQFQERITRVSKDYVAIVGDECHHYGTGSLLDALPMNARFRLGLSATPEHYLHAEITERITGYFGPVVYRYGLKEALEDDVLVPYRYYPHFVLLTPNEAEAYVELSKKIGQLAAGGSAAQVETSSEEALKFLLLKRARLLGNASGKLELLDNLLAASEPAPYHLFYCGDGTVEGDDEIEPARQVDLVSKILYDRGWHVSHFTSRESRQDRQTILSRFRIGLTQALVAIRCLDEGIDVPDCRVAYILASSRNPKQFIQRRGRILRKAPGKEFAVIHDFVVCLPPGLISESKLERELLAMELRRVSEFAELSRNRGEVFDKLFPILERYDLQHHFA